MPVKTPGKKVQVEVWTDRLRITGSLFIPGIPEIEYDARLSDFLNDGVKTFISLTQVTVGHVGGSEILWNGKFLMVNKNQICLIRVLKE